MRAPLNLNPHTTPDELEELADRVALELERRHPPAPRPNRKETNP